MAWEPDRRCNFFFIPPANLCAVTYMTEISLIVTLNNQFTLPYLLWQYYNIFQCSQAKLSWFSGFETNDDEAGINANGM